MTAGVSADAAAAAFRRVREQFPITATRAYLFAGGMAPLSSGARAALDEYAALWAGDPVAAYRAHPREQAELLREEIAGLIGADPADLAIVDSTSRGNNLAVQMLAAPPGANVVVDATTYPSALGPWLLRDGVEVRRAPSVDGRPSPELLRRLVDERTVAVSVSHVCRLTGFRHDLKALAAIAREAGAALVVDAAQSAGVVPIDVAADGVDFLAFGAMKWLLGAPGIAFFYVRPGLQERLAPPHLGNSALGDDGRLSLPAGGARHELGSLAWSGLEASRRGLALLLELPPAAVEARVLDLSGLLVDGLRARGATVWTTHERERRAGVVAFECDAPEAFGRLLRERGVDARGWERLRLMRVDPHVYNDEEDVRRFLDGYDAFRSSAG